MTTQMVIRINPELKKKLCRLARIEGKTVSQMVRDLIEDYIKEHDISSYIDDLWDRIGEKLRSNGVRPVDINRVIKDMRRRLK